MVQHIAVGVEKRNEVLEINERHLNNGSK